MCFDVCLWAQTVQTQRNGSRIGQVNRTGIDSISVGMGAVAFARRSFIASRGHTVTMRSTPLNTILAAPAWARLNCAPPPTAPTASDYQFLTSCSHH